MDAPDREPDTRQQSLLEELVGYLNFSSGTTDNRFLQNLNELFQYLERGTPTADTVHLLSTWLRATIERLEAAAGPFSDVTQARAAIHLLVDHLLPKYREFHHDLLFHQRVEYLWRPFFLGRAVEAILLQGSPWEETERIVDAALNHLNDYVGYRPVATLASGHASEPYPHEFVRPIPVYIRGAGVAVGRYERLLNETLEILANTSEEILARAWFDQQRLEEIAIDPRAYDFDHPVNRRPNYHFGQWDPHHISTDGYYTRFVLQQITLDALLVRTQEQSPGEQIAGSSEHRLKEAATVLAGTMLMASGTSGDAPGRHHSTVTLSTLLPHIAAYRDDFYQEQLQHAQGSYGEHLRAEEMHYRQPYGAARQHLNQELARRRALQLQRVHLAHVYARLGFPEAAQQQANSVRVAAARMLSDIYCRLTAGHDAIDNDQLASVVESLNACEDLIHRAIQCGALVDPWNVVGFAGNFSLFPALENTVHDWRVDELIELVEQVLDLSARAWSEAAAIDHTALEEQFSSFLSRFAAWWDQFATSAVEDVKRLIAKEIEVSANLVAGALNAWHKAGAAAGDIGFWRMFVDQFDSAKAFELVIEALLDHGDIVASRALMMQWISQKDRTPLEEGDSSFRRLAFRWLATLEEKQPKDEDFRWTEISKFFAYLEANAEEYWNVPSLNLDFSSDASYEEILDDIDGAIYFDDEDSELEDDDDEPDELFEAAYEEMIFRDSTDDGMEGDIVDEQIDWEYSEWEYEVQRIEQRLAFLSALASLWKHVAISVGIHGKERDQGESERIASFRQWLEQAHQNYTKLLELLDAVHELDFALPSGSHDSLVEYDRLRTVKEALVQSTITCSVETADAGRLLAATLGVENLAELELFKKPIDRAAIEILQVMLAGEADRVRKHWPGFLQSLESSPLLYVPHSRGGDPKQVVFTRGLQQLLFDLLGWLPQLGLIRETCFLLEFIQQLERDHPVGHGAVTEFDRLFENGYQAIVRAMVSSAEQWQVPPGEGRTQVDHLLVDALQQLTELQLQRWLQHSRTLRLSVVERLSEPKQWNRFVEFIKRYGNDFFDQKFMSRGNLRGILHQSVGQWIEVLEEDPEASEQFRLLQELDHDWPRKDAIELLSIAIEAVVENYRVYLDYNTTTTQSDRGDLLYTLIDFLRLKVGYDRVAWNLKPVVWAHEILVRQNRALAAEMWCQAFAERTAEAADLYQAKIEELSNKYGMRLATISERIGERFVRPLVIDRVKALVEPALIQTGEARNEAFAALEREISSLASEPCGAGIDLPDWLAALEDEVTTARSRFNHQSSSDRLADRIGQVRLTWHELLEQLEETS